MARFTGTDGDDFTSGGVGNDQVYGFGGNDQLYGVQGNDRIDAGIGNDYVSGGLGRDSIAGGAGDDYLEGDDNDASVPGGNDRLYGGDGNDQMYGWGGDDVIAGQRGNDLLYDDLGVNRLFGGDGNDELHDNAGLESGGAGFDSLNTAFQAPGSHLTMSGGLDGDSFNLFLNGTDDASQSRTVLKIEDFHRGEGDQLHVNAGVTVSGVGFSMGGADLFNAFDSNRTGTLGDGDEHAFKDGHGGVVAQWFNVDLILHGDATAASDWLS